ncbi:MAG: peptidyl-prolyl cis-trans isomerase [Baekduiaceae bacterium]
MAERFGWRAALFGALLVVVLVPGAVWAQGTPADVIANVDGQTPVARAEFDHWMTIAAARDGQTPGSTPITLPDHPGYTACAARIAKTKAGRGTTLAQRRDQCRTTWEGLRDQVLGFLLAARWVRGEAAEQRITVTAQEVAKAFTQQKKQAFPKDTDYKKFLKESGSTEEDIRFQLEVELLQQRLVARITRGKDQVTQAEIEAYYRQNKAQFVVPAGRDTLVVLTSSKSRALRARRALERGRSWAAVSAKYEIEGHTGDRMVVSRGDDEDVRFERAVFRAPVRTLQGPVKGSFGWYVFEVRRITKRDQQSLKEATPTIKSLLASRNQQRALDAFVTSYRRKWKARTGCLTGYVTDDCGATLPPPVPPA